MAGAQWKLGALQWVIPAFTGALRVKDELMSERRRPSEAASGVVRRLVPEELAA